MLTLLPSLPTLWGRACWGDIFLPLDSSESLWDVVDGTPWRGEHSSWKGQMTVSRIFVHPCQSQLRACAGAFLPLVSLDPSQPLGFEVVWAIAEKRRSHIGKKAKENRRYILSFKHMQDFPNMPSDLNCYSDGRREARRKQGREELQLLGPLNVTFLNGKTSSPTAHKTHLPLTLKS